MKGQDAKNLTLYFLKLKNKPATKEEMQKGVSQVKHLFNKGYTFDQIKGAIDRYIDNMYSIGYLFKTIDNYIGEEILNEVKEKELPKGGTEGDNQTKAKRFNNKSRFRKKCNLDLFKKPGDDK